MSTPIVRGERGFTLVEVVVTMAVMVVVLVGLGSTAGITTRTVNTIDRRAEATERVLRCFERITQFTRAGVLSTYQVEATAADVTAGRAPAVGAWIDPVDGEPRPVARLRAANGILAMNAGSLTAPIELRFRLDKGEDPAVNPGAAAGRDDDGDGLIDQGQLVMEYSGIRTVLLTGIDSCTLTVDGYLLTVQVRTARRGTSGTQFSLERVFTLRNN
jgi:prepilin-type N-terminal cleavage/methylation domain-containing protein